MNMNTFNITSAQYYQSKDVNDGIEAIIDGTTVYIPLDPANRHYAEILQQVEAGTLTIQDAE